MKSKITSWFTVFLSVVASIFFGASVQAQIDWSGVNQYRNNQRPSGGGGGYSRPSGPSQAQIAAQQAEAARGRQYNALNDSSVDSFNKGDYATAEAGFKKCLEYWPNDPMIEQSIACTQNQEGVAAYKNGDYTTALNFFQQSVANFPKADPNNPKINETSRQNCINALASAQDKIAEAKREEAQRQQDKITANNIQQSIQGLAQTLSAAPSSGGLDFNDGKSSASVTSATAGNSGGLDFIDSSPNVVDPRSANTATGGSARTKGSSSGDLAFMDSDSSLKDAVKDTPSDQKVTIGTFGDKVAKPNFATVAAPTIGKDTKAGDQLLGAAASGDLTANYDVGGAKTAGSLKKPTELPAAPATFSAVVKGDPRMKDALKQLDTLNATRSQLGIELQQLTTEMKTEKDSHKMSELSKKVDQKNNDYQANLVAITQGEEAVKKVHRTIIIEEEKTPITSSATTAPASGAAPATAAAK